MVKILSYPTYRISYEPINQLKNRMTAQNRQSQTLKKSIKKSILSYRGINSFKSIPESIGDQTLISRIQKRFCILAGIIKKVALS